MNSFWLFLARVSSQALAIIFTVLVARRLGETGLGQYAFIASIVFIGNVLTTFGLDTLIIRHVSGLRTSASPLLPAALWTQLGLSAVFIAAIGFAAGLLPGKTPATLFALKLYSLSLIPLAFFTVYSALLRAFERMDLYLLVNLVVALIQTGGAFVVLQFRRDLVSLVWVLLAAQVCGALASALLSARLLPGFRLQWRVPVRALGQAARLSWPLAVLAILAVIYQRVGLLLLSQFSGDAQTGWFSAAFRVNEAFKIVHYALLGALFPVMSHYTFQGNGDRKQPAGSPFYTRLSRVSLLFLLAFGFAAALSLNWLAGPLIQFLYGASYHLSTADLKILAWSLVPYAYASKASLDLVTAGREGVVVKGLALALGLASLLNLILIPALGHVGASLAVTIAESFQAILLFALGKMDHMGSRLILAGRTWDQRPAAGRPPVD